jgi:hypothetical protein
VLAHSVEPFPSTAWALGRPLCSLETPTSARCAKLGCDVCPCGLGWPCALLLSVRHPVAMIARHIHLEHLWHLAKLRRLPSRPAQNASQLRAWVSITQATYGEFVARSGGAHLRRLRKSSARPPNSLRNHLRITKQVEDRPDLASRKTVSFGTTVGNHQRRPSSPLVQAFNSLNFCGLQSKVENLQICLHVVVVSGPGQGNHADFERESTSLGCWRLVPDRSPARSDDPADSRRSVARRRTWTRSRCWLPERRGAGEDSGVAMK